MRECCCEECLSEMARISTALCRMTLAIEALLEIAKKESA